LALFLSAHLLNTSGQHVWSTHRGYLSGAGRVANIVATTKKFKNEDGGSIRPRNRLKKVDFGWNML
jgi:hypothetical protein